MGNSHHKRKAPSGPRARSFWRFGRSAKRPAGRGRGWGRGRQGGGSPRRSRSRRHRCCPSRGLVGVSVGGQECPAQSPPHMHTETRTHEYPQAGTHTCLQCIQTHNTHADVQMQTQNHIHIYTHTVLIGRTDPETQVPVYTVYTATRITPQRADLHNHTHTSVM